MSNYEPGVVPVEREIPLMESKLRQAIEELDHVLCELEKALIPVLKGIAPTTLEVKPKLEDKKVLCLLANHMQDKLEFLNQVNRRLYALLNRVQL